MFLRALFRNFESGNLAEEKVDFPSCKLDHSIHGSKLRSSVNSNGTGIFSILNILSRYFNKGAFSYKATPCGVRTMSITSGLELCGYVECDLEYLIPSYDQVVDFVSRLDKPSECVFYLHILAVGLILI